MAVLLLTVSSASAALPESNKEYYIWLNIYEKLLGFSEDDNSPAISAFGVKLPESYVFGDDPEVGLSVLIEEVMTSFLWMNIL